MKIGIITLSASDNCGSLLQGYALKKLLSAYGETEIINFSSQSSHNLYDLFPVNLGLIDKIKRLFCLEKLKSAKLGYEEFRTRFLGITGKEYYANELIEIADKYEMVVVGSDQVWNVLMSDFDEAFFLNWTNAKKVAYAPSLGGKHLNQSEHFEEISSWIKDIEYLSVREEAGKECLEEVTGRAVEKVLDPTLVLEESVWLDMVQKPLVEGEYIFYYSWAYCDAETSQIVAEEANRLGLPVYVIDARKWIGRRPQKWGFTLFEGSGPEIFLNLMCYASRCYVESFHGMVFAYIFKKNFWLLDTHENLDDLDSRLMEFVNLLGAQKRIITKYNVSKVDQSKEMVYEKNIYLEEMRKKSKEFLNKAFGGAKL